MYSDPEMFFVMELEKMAKEATQNRPNPHFGYEFIAELMVVKGRKRLKSTRTIKNPRTIGVQGNA